MRIPELSIGGLTAKVPIIQGGMAVGVSGPKLAAAVANAGGVGVIAGVGIGYREPDFSKNMLEANLRAVKSQIRQARQLAPTGVIGINLMVAMNHYGEMVRAAAEAGADVIISGAGLPLKLPDLLKGFQTRIAPIVSSARAADTILHFWDKHYGKTADMVIVEGPEAGGHLGFSEEMLLSDNTPALTGIVNEVIDTVSSYEQKFRKKIPVIAAGGIYTGQDIARYLKAGAGGVQMATRFVATDECDADIKFKEAYVAAKQDDIVIIKSPVGMPGRALHNSFIQKVTEQGDEIRGCFQCLKGCNPKVAPYCIFKALANAVSGRLDEGLIFVGSNVYRVNKIVLVKELMEELVRDTELALNA
ncbi:MAG: nitronate monooxygenase [Clostridia bacterium]|nr:nitronate monooxygenase [Clostridia bacterium]